MNQVPDLVPMLSAGKHRSPRTGGCFMEIASFLAGERWSDHPKCVDPSLGELARCVNDVMPDDRRSQLALMIPSVIGTGHRRPLQERAVLAALVVRSCSVHALPHVRSKAVPIACALIVSERLLGIRTAAAEGALATRPAAAATAESLTVVHADTWRPARTYVSLAVPPAIKLTVQTVSDELGPDAWPLLSAMLGEAVAAVRERCRLEQQPDAVVTGKRWQEAGDLVGAARRETWLPG